MPTDREILASIVEKIGVKPKKAEFDGDNRLIELDLFQSNLAKIPSEIGLLTNLQTLDLSGNFLNQLSQEFEMLINLKELRLWGNKFIQFPKEIGRLANLQDLNIGNNQLTELSPQIWQLEKLEDLWLVNNQLNYISPEIGQLYNLRTLGLHGNKFDFDQLPSELWQLPNLQTFGLGGEQLNNLPAAIWQLTNLKRLIVAGSKLNELPSTISQLVNLEELLLPFNRLSELPPLINKLINLRNLFLLDNFLVELPSQIGQLTNLEFLNLSNNQLTLLPLEITQLIKLQRLELSGNPIRTPPPEIVERGTQDILVFMHDLKEGIVPRYEAKLLLVGEGRTGKTSFLRALNGEKFNPNLDSTHGIEVKPYLLPHLNQSETEITLNVWDFGGQQIYHSTHQFFMTKRSLYLVIWNAGVDTDQARLDHWLKTIQVLAPDSPVLLVATHLDQRQPDLNYQRFKETYPQLVGHFAVSNKTRRGIKELKTAIAAAAAQLPLMDQQWPQKWVAAEGALLARPEHHLDLERYLACCVENGVKPEIAETVFGGYLHDLGRILYFQDDDNLSDFIVLKPNWVTKAISRVLTDETVRTSGGILAHANLPRIWAIDDEGIPYERRLYPIFLRLMERFDLSYQLEAVTPGEPTTHSLIPLLLPFQPPPDLPGWPIEPPVGQTQIEMIYRLDFVPTGIMSWFIVRTHRYTTNAHWREGVVLSYQGHQARVELNPGARELRLLVWGPQPHNFFTILKETLDLILARFEGLKIIRDVPCICHWQTQPAKPCRRFYSYKDLIRRMEARKHTVECPDSFREVSVPTLLYGIHPSTEPDVIANIREMRQELSEGQRQLLEGQREVLERLQQQSELIVRTFTRQWNLEMKRIEAECPNTFILMPGERGFNPKNWISQEYRLYLVCQHPAGPHVVGQGYSLRQAEAWWVEIYPWVGYLLKFLKYGMPMSKVTGLEGLAGLTEEAVKQMEEGIKVLEQINTDLPRLETSDTVKRMAAQPRMGEEAELAGPALRVLHTFLKQADPAQTWGGLHKTLTPDGNILWLCGEHRQAYVVEPLVLDIG